MNNIDDKEAIELLRKAGWTSLEIERLRQFRRNYAEKGERTLRDQQRPAFVRWLLILLQEGFPTYGIWWW
jgi:type II secretory pathway component PulF